MITNEKDAAEIKDLYQKGKGTIQDYARLYRYEVHEVLELLGEQHLSQVSFTGDLVDYTELGPGRQHELNTGEHYQVPFTTN
jgi:hypothetical protein